MLNVRQENFCLEYASNGNATEAYLKAYGTMDFTAAASSASKLLRNSKVKTRLKELADELASKKIATAQELQERLTAIIRGEVTEETILPNGERLQKKVAVRDVLRAVETLCRIQGLFVVKQEVNFKSAPVIISGSDMLED